MKRRTFLQGFVVTPLILEGCKKGDIPVIGQDAKSPSADVTRSNDLLPASNNVGEPKMYGLIAKMNATAGNRDKLIEILLAATKDMPGCKLYAISTDTADENGIWITEIWDSEQSHQASLQLPSVQRAIADGKPMIAGFGERHIVTPVGGIGVR